MCMPITDTVVTQTKSQQTPRIFLGHLDLRIKNRSGFVDTTTQLRTQNHERHKSRSKRISTLQEQYNITLETPSLTTAHKEYNLAKQCLRNVYGTQHLTHMSIDKNFYIN